MHRLGPLLKKRETSTLNDNSYLYQGYTVYNRYKPKVNNGFARMLRETDINLQVKEQQLKYVKDTLSEGELLFALHNSVDSIIPRQSKYMEEHYDEYLGLVSDLEPLFVYASEVVSDYECSPLKSRLINAVAIYSLAGGGGKVGEGIRFVPPEYTN